MRGNLAVHIVTFRGRKGTIVHIDNETARRPRRSVPTITSEMVGSHVGCVVRARSHRGTTKANVAKSRIRVGTSYGVRV